MSQSAESSSQEATRVRITVPYVPSYSVGVTGGRYG